ncbi:hypothetical protein [Micromonospora chersina]
MSRGRTVGKCRYDGKATFRTYETAASAARRLPEPGEPYWCGIAGGWHIRRGDQAEYDRRQALRWSVNSGGGEVDSTGAVGAVGRVEA